MRSTNSFPLQPSNLLFQYADPTSGKVLATASLTSDFAAEGDPRGGSYTLKLNKPVSITRGSLYYLQFEIDNGILELRARP